MKGRKAVWLAKVMLQGREQLDDRIVESRRAPRDEVTVLLPDLARRTTEKACLPHVIELKE